MAERRHDDVRGHVVVGAASGIGAAAAAELAQRGAKVACLDVNADGAVRTRGAIAAAGGEALALGCDIAQPVEVEEAIGATVVRWGTIQALVNCAGITGRTGAPSQDISLDDFDRVLSVNLRGAFIVTQRVLPVMLGAGYGRVLHVSSIAGKEGNPGMVSYSTSKAGLIGMVKSMGKECAGTGVTVNAIAPAVIETPLNAETPTAQLDYMVQKIPMGRLGTLQEAADAIAWAVSPATSFTTGFTYDLSGGRATY